MINFDPVKRFQYLSFNVFSAVWVAIILLTNFPLFFDFYVGSSYAPKYYIFTLVIAIAYFLTAPVKSLRFVKEPFVWWFLFYFLVVYANYIRLSIGDYPSDYAEDEFDILERIIILPALAFICWRSVPAMLWLFLPIAFLVISFGNIYDLMFLLQCKSCRRGCIAVIGVAKKSLSKISVYCSVYYCWIWCPGHI